MNAPHAVIVWNPQDQDDYEVVTIEWADRCVEKYQLNICQFPYDCRQDSKDSLYYRTFDVMFHESELANNDLQVKKFLFCTS